MEQYLTMKFLHILGVSMFIGNMLVTALLKGLIEANKTPNLVAFGQKFITITDILFFGLSTVLITVSGIYMNPDFINTHYLEWAFYLYVTLGLIWIFFFIPIQTKQSKLAKEFKNKSVVPPLYWKLEQYWKIGGIISIIITFIILYLMIIKPF